MSGETVTFTESPETATPSLFIGGYEYFGKLAIDGVSDRLQEFAPNPNYERYLRMHKVLVGNSGAEELEQVHASLREEAMPRYLYVAGWAAAEAAVANNNRPTEQRLQLLDDGIACWVRGMYNQQWLNTYGNSHTLEHSAPLRSAVAVATAPLLKGIILGDITKETMRTVFEDSLRIAQANVVCLDIASKERDTDAVADHLGLAYEMNAQLLVNRWLSPTRFLIPSFARSDTGYYYPDQTHDLLAVHQKWGKIYNIAPVEIKSSASARDRERYRALLVRGKMHLSIEGRFAPGDTLQMITDSYEGVASLQQQAKLDAISIRFMNMMRDYYNGEPLAGVATEKGKMVFRDNAIVVGNHPGLVRVD